MRDPARIDEMLVDLEKYGDKTPLKLRPQERSMKINLAAMILVLTFWPSSVPAKIRFGKSRDGVRIAAVGSQTFWLRTFPMSKSGRFHHTLWWRNEAARFDHKAAEMPSLDLQRREAVDAGVDPTSPQSPRPQSPKPPSPSLRSDSGVSQEAHVIDRQTIEAGHQHACHTGIAFIVRAQG